MSKDYVTVESKASPKIVKFETAENNKNLDLNETKLKFQYGDFDVVDDTHLADHNLGK